MVYRWCTVTLCKDNSKTTPERIFFRVPLDVKIRKLWLKAIGRNPKNFSMTSSLYVCEKHFNLKEDMANYLEWQMVGVRKKLKKDVVPHIFDCQQETLIKFNNEQITGNALEANTSTNVLVNATPKQPVIKEITPLHDDIPQYKHKRFRTISLQVKPSRKDKSVQC